MSDTEEGGKIRTIHLRFKVPTSPRDVHDTAGFEAYDEAMYRYVMDVIARINAAGWKRYIPQSLVRRFMQERTEAEAKARAQGARVLTDWKDPGIAGVAPPSE
ncbi:hypothetical protein C8K18_1312 [Paraburkholderia sp. GV068]|uniref:hypothetical protein n=1 Tax=Paraburkholderia TaxID=1822464 RepID=UPI000D406ADA|nr:MULTISPECIES: hypothetical protein [unclassified Paraburkholderia]PTQ91455.1 hypothetical protein C8K19_13027 [Paraburkholderia sp. GV072]PUA93625.1 hypothetical protein C8K18_1312 [Paraburkholderia sp. GV068]